MKGMENMAKKKMLQVDAITHQMIKELALKNGLTINAYVMKLAYEEKAKEMKR